MFRYRYLCKDKERFIKGIEDKMFYDRPVEYTLFHDLLGRGIHFRENGEQIKGFFFYDRETTGRGGSPIKIKFKGSFVEEDVQLFFDVSIYPPIWVVLTFVIAIISCINFDRWDGLLIIGTFTFLFARWHYKAIQETARIFDRMIV